MSASADDVQQGVWKAVIPRDWNNINKGHLKVITAHWIESQRATTDADSLLQYKPHAFLSLTHSDYVCIATRGGVNASNDLRYLYQFKRTALKDAYDLYWVGRCPGHNYDDPKTVAFPHDTYRIPDPRLVPAVPAAPAPAAIPAAAAEPDVIPPLEERTLAQKIKYGFT